MRHNINEAEDLYNHVAEIFNIWSKSQYFLREEQNFISANEIDNMVLIMPTATRRTVVPDGSQPTVGKVVSSLSVLSLNQINYQNGKSYSWNLGLSAN